MLKLIEKYSDIEKRKIEQLVDEDGVIWMSSTNYEIQNMLAAARWFKGGRVLIGGLGLGIIVKMIQPKAEWIDIIELDQDVIDAVWPSVKAKNIWICKDNILDIPRKWMHNSNDNLKYGYNFIFQDVWPDLDYLRLPAVYKLTQAYKPLLKPGGRILNWGEWLMKKEYKKELYIYIRDLRQYRLQDFPIYLLQKIEDKRPYFYPFCEWLFDHPGIWLDSNNERKIKNAIGRFATQFIHGSEYLGIAEPTKGVALDMATAKQLGLK